MKTFVLLNTRLTFGKSAIFVIFCCLLVSTQAVAAPGRVDLAFPNVLESGANVSAIEIQSDGKILAAGRFTIRGAAARRDLVRLNANGTVDTTFNFLGTSGDILALKLQSDGKILVGGNFNQINGQFRSAIARLNSDGSLDTTFNLTGINVTFVFDLDVQTDGRILISASNLIGAYFVTRLSSGGANEPGVGTPLFRANINGNIYRVTFSPAQNKILISGNFTHNLGQTQYKNLIRLNLDATVDTSLNPVLTINAASFDLIVNVRLLAGEKILLWGKFETVNGATRRNLAVVNNDGSLDMNFNPATSGIENLLSVAIESSGKIIIGGSNFAFNTVLRGNIARLNPDGSADATFNQSKGANNAVHALKIRNDKLLMGGSFHRYQVFPRNGFVQLSL